MNIKIISDKLLSYLGEESVAGIADLLAVLSYKGFMQWDCILSLKGFPSNTHYLFDLDQSPSLNKYYKSARDEFINNKNFKSISKIQKDYLLNLSNSLLMNNIVNNRNLKTREYLSLVKVLSDQINRENIDHESVVPTNFKFCISEKDFKED